MRTRTRFAVLTLAAAVTVALLVVPGLARASGGAAEDTGGRIEPAPPSPAVDLPLPAVAPQPAVDLPLAVAEPTGATDPAPPAKPAERRSDPNTAVSSPPVAKPAPAPLPPEARSDPNGSVSSPVMPFDPGYWTPERMANAKPMPMPTVP